MRARYVSSTPPMSVVATTSSGGKGDVVAALNGSQPLAAPIDVPCPSMTLHGRSVRAGRGEIRPARRVEPRTLTRMRGCRCIREPSTYTECRPRLLSTLISTWTM